MSDPAPFTLETRSLSFRADTVDTEKGIIRGIAVPYNTPVRIREWWSGEEYDEQFAPGSVDDERALAFWRHDEPIGRMLSGTDTDAGREVELKISDTALGRDALTLARDGAVVELSVGFEPGGDHTVEERENDVPLVTRTRVRVREVSLVPFGAYGQGATVSEVRQRPADPHKENHMNTTAPTEVVDTEAREHLEELDRRFQLLGDTITQRPAGPVGDQRSAGAFLQALARGDEDAIAAYNRSQEHRHDEMQHRAYTGGTTADAPIQDAWVGDLTRIFDASSGVLSQIFSTGTLPATGMNVEYAELLSNTVTVTEQAAEGDDLAYGQVKLTTKTAPVKTYGGVTQLTRQQIERSTLPILNRSLEALSVAAGARKKAVLRAAYNTLVTARGAIAANAGVIVLGATLANSKDSHWTDAVIEAAIRYDALALGIDKLVVSPSVFKKLKNSNAIEVVTVGEGEQAIGFDRSFKISSAPQAGTLNLPGLEGDLAGLPVVADPGFTSDHAAFVNHRALRQYDSALVSLQDENIVNLSKDFSVYRYGAVAAEIPAAVVPIKLAAS